MTEEYRYCDFIYINPRAEPCVGLIHRFSDRPSCELSVREITREDIIDGKIGSNDRPFRQTPLSDGNERDPYYVAHLIMGFIRHMEENFPALDGTPNPLEFRRCTHTEPQICSSMTQLINNVTWVLTGKNP